MLSTDGESLAELLIGEVFLTAEKYQSKEALYQISLSFS
jgi:hypothetical protein